VAFSRVKSKARASGRAAPNILISPDSRRASRNCFCSGVIIVLQVWVGPSLAARGEALRLDNFPSVPIFFDFPGSFKRHAELDAGLHRKV